LDCWACCDANIRLAQPNGFPAKYRGRIYDRVDGADTNQATDPSRYSGKEALTYLGVAATGLDMDGQVFLLA